MGRTRAGAGAGAQAELSKEARIRLRQFQDVRQRQERLTSSELRKALERTGIDPDEIQAYFKEYDTDGNQEIDKKEFMALMESTGAFDDM